MLGPQGRGLGPGRGRPPLLAGEAGVEVGHLLDAGVELALQGGDAPAEALDEGLGRHVEIVAGVAVGRRLSLRR